ncbi:MAG: hypothetical protein IPK03_04825 [Bacteroidetes bacterium]|nr:hypothetical protein [Bacteroidota bacterium]
MKIFISFFLFFTFNLNAQKVDFFKFADSADKEVHALKSFKVMSNGDIWMCMNEYDSIISNYKYNAIIIDSSGKVKLEKKALSFLLRHCI